MYMYITETKITGHYTVFHELIRINIAVIYLVFLKSMTV